jgi:hypothetical protein
VAVGRRKKGDRLKATQSMVNNRWQCNSRSPESVEIPVVPPDSRIKPKIVSTLYEGDHVIMIENQVEGGTITLLLRPSMSAPEEDVGSRPSSVFPEVPVPNPPLHAGQVLRVMQELCGVKEFSDPAEVQKRPTTIDGPRIRKPLFDCGEVVAVDNVIPGAWVYVRQTPPKFMSPEYPIGQAKAIGTSVVVRALFPLLRGDAFVTAHQVVGGQPSGPAPWVQVGYNTDFLPPKVVPPAIVDHESVWLEGVVPGAHIRIFDRGFQIGYGSLPDAEGSVDLWWKIPDGAILTARQALCQGETHDSPPRPALSAAACEGPPKYDLSKWNDGGQIQGCNNCYNYACDVRTDNFAQPGGTTSMNCNDVARGARADGLRPCPIGRCHPCHHRVALVVNPGNDYHWYRQHADGSWSHKRGCQAAKNVDESNNPISDPSVADRGPYSDFCGYFCVYKPDVKIKGPGCKCWP